MGSGPSSMPSPDKIATTVDKFNSRPIDAICNKISTGHDKAITFMLSIGIYLQTNMGLFRCEECGAYVFRTVDTCTVMETSFTGLTVDSMGFCETFGLTLPELTAVRKALTMISQSDFSEDNDDERAAYVKLIGQLTQVIHVARKFTPCLEKLIALKLRYKLMSMRAIKLIKLSISVEKKFMAAIDVRKSIANSYKNRDGNSMSRNKKIELAKKMRCAKACANKLKDQFISINGAIQRVSRQFDKTLMDGKKYKHLLLTIVDEFDWLAVGRHDSCENLEC
jgi:hypothetical protein